MNVSMQDTYKLVWKLAALIRGASPRDMLGTYAQERLPISRRLIQLDQRLCCGMRSASRGGLDQDHKRAVREENTSVSGSERFASLPSFTMLPQYQPMGFNQFLGRYFQERKEDSHQSPSGSTLPPRLLLPATEQGQQAKRRRRFSYGAPDTFCTQRQVRSFCWPGIFRPYSRTGVQTIPGCWWIMNLTTIMEAGNSIRPLASIQKAVWFYCDLINMSPS